MIKLKKQFGNFYDSIKIASEASVLREKRTILQSDFERKFPDICFQNGVEINKSDMRFIDQGSYKISTTICDPNGAVDRDVAVIFPLDIKENSDPRKFKKYAKEALEIENIRTPKIKEPCITVEYHKRDEEYIHIDFPLYANYENNLYLARGKEFSDNYSWEIADPEGLNEYFSGELKKSEQLRRIIRYLKKWKQEIYKDSAIKNQIPPSIGLTILACKYFREMKEEHDYDDLSALYHVFEKITGIFELVFNNQKLVKADITVCLPTQPYSDVFYKLKNSDSYGVLFYNGVKHACNNLRDACNVETEHEAALYVQKVLGSDFEVPEKDAVIASTSNRKEHSFG